MSTEKGHWIPKPVMVRTPTAKNYICSICGKEGFKTKYCENCSAYMEKKR